MSSGKWIRPRPWSMWNSEPNYHPKSEACREGKHQSTRDKGCKGRIINQYHQIRNCECECHDDKSGIRDSSETD